MTSEHKTGSAQPGPTGQPATKKAALTRRIQPYIVPLLLLFCTVFYYFGELVDWAHWGAVRLDFFYSVHDAHRLLFLAPIVYAGYAARVRGALIVTLISFVIFLPRAFFISPFPDPLLRMGLFTIFAGTIGCLIGVVRNETEEVKRLQALTRAERDKLINIIDSMADGLLIIGPDYRIRFMNAIMAKDFGDGTGLLCYKHLHNLNAPCEKNCMITKVIKNRKIGKWKDKLPDGRTYAIVTAPYIDMDGMVCQLSIYRKIQASKRA